MSIRNRVFIIVALIAASVYALFPRDVEMRMRQADGSFRDTTVRRVPLKKGLDLSGGMHLALEIDESQGTVADREDAIDRALKVVRTRIDEFGVAEPVVQKVGTDRIIVELPGIDDRERAEALVKSSAFLQFQLTDETGALERALPRIDRILRDLGEGARVATATGDTASRLALDQLFTTDSATPGDTTVADTAQSDLVLGADGALSSLIQPTGLPGEYAVSEENISTVRRYFSLPQVRAAIPPGKVVRFGGQGDVATQPGFRTFYMLDARPIITGEYLIDARPGTDPMEGNVVTFELNNQGGRRFRAETQRHIGDYMAIVLDDVVQGQPPVIRSAIGTSGQITMSGKPLQAAQDLALVLRAGALPVKLQVIESRTIGASLGDDAIRQGLQAGALSVVLVVLIMVGYYRFSGFLAVCGLVFYGLTTLAILAGFDAVLTLPGLAGFVLSIGMAVDANFLIFERIREELDDGKTLRRAIDGGFEQAWSAIVDTHVTTALTAAILYQFGTGPVRGFAVALLAGLAASLVSAIFVVRTLFLIWLQRSREAQTLSI
ncbi:MAG TPA: protein translocase subunit SecD [Gemmatimonadaceae bacterium]|nr:protein translocase subunit SecD [Gemmatimonadaceae bacterium]